MGFVSEAVVRWYFGTELVDLTGSDGEDEADLSLEEKVTLGMAKYLSMADAAEGDVDLEALETALRLSLQGGGDSAVTIPISVPTSGKRKGIEVEDGEEASSKRVRAAAASYDRLLETIRKCWKKQKKTQNTCGWFAVRLVLCLQGNHAMEERRTFDQVLRRMYAQFGGDIPSDGRHFIGYSADEVVSVMNSEGVEPNIMYASEPDYEFQVQHIDANTSYIIVGNTRHWYPIVRVGEEWFNADSLQPEESAETEACEGFPQVAWFPDGLAGVKRFLLNKYNVPRKGGKASPAGVLLLSADSVRGPGN